MDWAVNQRTRGFVLVVTGPKPVVALLTAMACNLASHRDDLKWNKSATFDMQSKCPE
jgi:hypothetical protein